MIDEARLRNENYKTSPLFLTFFICTLHFLMLDTQDRKRTIEVESRFSPNEMEV